MDCFFSERRMKFREATVFVRKSGMWDTAGLPLKPAEGYKKMLSGT
jgi:hypothetical protein